MKMNVLSKLLIAFVATITLASCCNNKPKEPQRTDADIVLDAIATRVSVRSYTNQPIENEKVEAMLRAAMAAPTAINKQPWHFIVIDKRETLDALAQVNHNTKALESAPLAIVVCGNMEKAIGGNGRDFWIQDCSAATENILLAAHALGLGAVWTGLYPAIERCVEVANVIETPEYIVPLSLIIMGYPNEQNSPKDKWNTDNISYNVYGNTEPTTQQNSDID